MIGHRPSGRMCHGCEHRERDCSRLDFASMPVIKADKDGTQVVKCSQYVRAEPKNVPPIRWASAPEGAEYFSLHNWCFYRGERPNLEVYIHGWHPTMLPEEFDKHLVRRPVTVADARQSSAQAQEKQLALEAAARSAEERRGREQEKRLGPCVNYPACGCKVQHGYDCIPF